MKSDRSTCCCVARPNFCCKSICGRVMKSQQGKGGGSFQSIGFGIRLKLESGLSTSSEHLLCARDEKFCHTRKHRITSELQEAESIARPQNRRHFFAKSFLSWLKWSKRRRTFDRRSVVRWTQTTMHSSAIESSSVAPSPPEAPLFMFVRGLKTETFDHYH